MVKSKRTEHGAERGLWDGEAHRHYRENFLGQWQPLLTCCRCPGMLSKRRMLHEREDSRAPRTFRPAVWANQAMSTLLEAQGTRGGG